MYIASKLIGGHRFSSSPHETRESAVDEFFATWPKVKSCTTSDAYQRNGKWYDRSTNIQFHDRPYWICIEDDAAR
jgi:hypothetical protein